MQLYIQLYLQLQIRHRASARRRARGLALESFFLIFCFFSKRSFADVVVWLQKPQKGPPPGWAVSRASLDPPPPVAPRLSHGVFKIAPKKASI